MIKGIVVGLGKMGFSHAAIVSAHPEVDMVPVCDTSTLILDAFRKFTLVHTYTDYTEMLEKENPDFVLIATPTRFHYPMVKLALEQSRHVYCEKPFSLHTYEGKELVHLAENKGLVNQIGYHNHFIGTFCELKRLIKVGILGEIVHFLGEAHGVQNLKRAVAASTTMPRMY
jgi:predicted dehydrogenase